MTLTSQLQQLQNIYLPIYSLLSALPLGDTLRQRERERACGQLVHNDPVIAREVVYVLRRAPELFPESAGAADKIEQHADLADEWDVLARLLAGSARHAADQALHHRIQMVTLSRQVTGLVEDALRQPKLLPRGVALRRAELMERALRLLRSVFLARVKRRTLSGPAPEPEGPTPEPEAPSSKAPSSKAARQRVAQQRDDRAAWLGMLLARAEDALHR